MGRPGHLVFEPLVYAPCHALKANKMTAQSAQVIRGQTLTFLNTLLVATVVLILSVYLRRQDMLR
jgi:hypothetical protein